MWCCHNSSSTRGAARHEVEKTSRLCSTSSSSLLVNANGKEIPVPTSTCAHGAAKFPLITASPAPMEDRYDTECESSSHGASKQKRSQPTNKSSFTSYLPRRLRKRFHKESRGSLECSSPKTAECPSKQCLSTDCRSSSTLETPLLCHEVNYNHSSQQPPASHESSPEMTPLPLTQSCSNTISLASHAALGGHHMMAPSSGLATSRRGSLYIFRHSEEPIVTPFAQILSTLRKVRLNFMSITNTTSNKKSHFGISPSVSSTGHHVSNTDDSDCSRSDGTNAANSNPLAVETLEELEWCLEQLETIQTHRSVSDMATSKFKKLLSKELSQYVDTSKSGNQISQYICSTFLGNDSMNVAEGRSDDDIPEEEEEEESTSAGHSNNQKDLGPAKIHETCTEIVSPSSHKPPSILSSRKNKHPSNHASTVTFSTSKCSDKNNSENSSYVVTSSGSAIHSTLRTLSREASAGSPYSEYPKELSCSADKDMSEEGLLALDQRRIIAISSGELGKLLEEEVDSWGIDIFRVAELTNHQPLCAVTFNIFKRRGLLAKFDIDPVVFVRYLHQLENHYHIDIPYHNSIHAADVTQSTHVLLSAPALENVFSDLEILSALFACAIHDVNHPGLTNQYLINTGDPLAILYNDSSVLESHHLAVAFSILKEKGCDIFARLTRKQRGSVRKMSIDMVLATDMSKHMSLLADLKTMVETKKVSGSGVLNLDNYNEKLQILQNMVHCADLSNPAKPLSLYREWTSRIMAEFFRQGDKERGANIDISPMCDRETASVERSQVSFIDFIAHPLWETWADLVHPDAQEIFDTLQENRDWYCSQIAQANNECSCDATADSQEQSDSGNVDHEHPEPDTPKTTVKSKSSDAMAVTS